MRYLIAGDHAFNARVLEQHVVPMRNNVSVMHDQINWLVNRVGNMHTHNVRPDPQGECDGTIVDEERFALVHKMVTDAAAAVAVLYRETERRITRETARTQMQLMDGTL